jgi:hypothetical protein
VIARLTGQIGNRPARRKSTQTAAGDEIESQGKNAAVVENPVAEEIGHVLSVFKRSEIDETGGGGIVELVP